MAYNFSHFTHTYNSNQVDNLAKTCQWKLEWRLSCCPDTHIEPISHLNFAGKHTGHPNIP